jgi:hypothetical protein
MCSTRLCAAKPVALSCDSASRADIAKTVSGGISAPESVAIVTTWKIRHFYNAPENPPLRANCTMADYA